MRTALYDQVYLVPVARKPLPRAFLADAQTRLVELEFSQEFRSPRLSLGLLLLPGAILPLLFVLAIL